MNGKLIVIEGVDGSGKSTQFDLLQKRLGDENEPFFYQRFPRYDNPSSQLVRMYLGGEFGDSPDDTNAYTASAYFAVDRAAAFAGEMGNFYRGGGTLLCDRYTTSNAVHQAAKLQKDRRIEFVEWLFDFEYNKLELPRPDVVLFLDMPDAVSLMLRGRRGKHEDIHEADVEFIKKSADTARHIAETYKWNRVDCMCGGELRTPEDIFEEIYGIVRRFVGV